MSSYLAERYSFHKNQRQTEGRRKCAQYAVADFWALQSSPSSSRPDSSNTTLQVGPAQDPDPADEILSTHELGLVVRTDFSNDSAWEAFCLRLKEAQDEIAASTESEMDPMDDNQHSSSAEQGTTDNNVGMDDEDTDDSSSNDDDPLAIFKIISSPPSLLTSISNLTALRLFNDVAIAAAPNPPQGVKRIKPGNPLVDLNGWQEIYLGKDIWIYDERSNIDQSVRVVGQRGAGYGTATGDSWRAKVSHIAELQIHLSSGALSIDFGGLDRWDFQERQRNMQEAVNSTLSL